MKLSNWAGGGLLGSLALLSFGAWDAAILGFGIVLTGLAVQRFLEWLP